MMKIDTRKELPDDKNVNVITFAREGGRLRCCVFVYFHN